MPCGARCFDDNRHEPKQFGERRLWAQHRSKHDGQIMGNQVSVVGIVEQFDASVVAVAGWDPRSSSQTVPAATGMFVEKLSEARIELINQAG